jgi:predicted ferric reductase
MNAAAASGIAALALWCASFVLMLRLPVLERLAGGLDRLYWWHHACGVLTYLALLAHPLVVAAQAFAADGWPASAALAVPPGAGAAMWAGWLALGLLMAMMTATFWVPLAYSRWRVVHAIAAPAFLLGVAHAWAFAGPVSRVALAVITAVALAALAWRFALDRGWVRGRRYRVSRVAHPGLGLLDLDLHPEGAPLDWRAGQFVFVAFGRGPHWRGCGEYHPYTIAGHAAGGGLRMLIRALGHCTRRLQSVPVGTGAMVQGPYGAFLAQRDPRRAQLWVAGGIGITPFLAALAQPVQAQAAPVDLVHLHRPGDVPVHQCLAPGRAQPVPGARLVAIESEGGVDEAWSRLVERVGVPVGRQVFLCGPPPLVDGLSARLLEAGVAARDIHSEKFDFR